MKTLNAVTIAILFSFSFILCSCNSTGYEIEIVEVETPPVKTPVIDAQQQPAGIQNTEVNEIKTPEKQDRFFTIQIGAFKNEHNAEEYLDKAKSSFNFEVTYVQVDGLFKLRTRTFNSSQEAESVLQKVIALGFADSFVIPSVK